MDNVITPAVVPTEAASPAEQLVEVGYDANMSTDVAEFAGSLERAADSARVTEPSAAAEAMLAPLDYIDGEARSLIEYAESAVASGNELTPSEIVMLTARSQEFMFHAQLTSNVANRTADGLQQLFRQQS